MSEESTTPDLVERWRQMLDAWNRRDIDAVVSVFAPDAVFEMMPLGTSFDGAAAIRGFLEEWMGSYEAVTINVEEILNLGNGVALAELVMDGRPVGSRGEVRNPMAQVGMWVDGVVVRMTVYPDIDEARAAAERLTEERG